MTIGLVAALLVAQTTVLAPSRDAAVDPMLDATERISPAVSFSTEAN